MWACDGAAQTTWKRPVTGVKIKDENGSSIYKAWIQQCFKCGWKESESFTQSGVLTNIYQGLTSASIKKD